MQVDFTGLAIKCPHCSYKIGQCNADHEMLTSLDRERKKRSSDRLRFRPTQNKRMLDSIRRSYTVTLEINQSTEFN